METKRLFIPAQREYRIAITTDESQQINLSGLCGPRRQERLKIKTRAQLELRDDDAAVRVFIEGIDVGCLTKTSTRAFHRIVRYGERSPHQAFECAALIHGISGTLSVNLDLPLED